jgi:hypothetical protein
MAPVLVSSSPFPVQADCRRFYGTPGANHVKLVPPYDMTYEGKPVKSIAINKKCADSAFRALTQIAKEYNANDRKALGLSIYAGCFNNRPMRGGSQLSMHAYACAIDFDPARNQLKWGREGTKLANGKLVNVPRLSLPDCVAFWKAWEAEGWLSLGRARNFDWMHVQAARL